MSVKGDIVKKSKTCTVITPKYPKGTAGWIEKEGVAENKGKVVLYKRVSKDFKTQEGTANETSWEIGKTLSHPSWNPTYEECGEGKFHACSTPYFCDEFRSNQTDVYIAIEVATKDMYAWEDPFYPHKIAFREGKVLYQCDRFGDKI